MIKVKELSFQYKKSAPLILNNLSFEVQDGTILSILGKNGVGKTTFIRCLTAEIKNYSGSIMIDGAEVKELSVSALSKNIAVVASNNPCYQNLSVADFLVTGFANRHTLLQIPSRQQYGVACTVLEGLGHVNLLNRDIFELSSGEMQIVKIARAILQNPKIIVFDEPTSNLDIKNQLMVLNQITNLAQRGYTVITTTHNPGQSIELGGMVLMMASNKYMFGKMEDVLNKENLCSVYDLDVSLERSKVRNIVTFRDDMNIHRLVY